MTRKAKGAPFQMRSGNATPFKNMASSYVQPTDSPIQEGDSPLQQSWKAKIAKWLWKKGSSKVDDIVETVKKKKTKKVTVKPKTKKTKPKTKTKTTTKPKTKTKTTTKTKTKTKTKKPTQKETITELEKQLAKKTAEKTILQQGKDVSKDITVGVLKAGTTVGLWEGGKWAINAATGGSDDESNTSVKDVGSYLDEPNKLITSEGDTLDLSKNVIKKGDY